VLLTFTLDPAKIAPLRERYKLNEDVFRVQITLAPPPARDSAKEADKGAKAAGKPVPAEAGKPVKI